MGNGKWFYKRNSSPQQNIWGFGITENRKSEIFGTNHRFRELALGFIWDKNDSGHICLKGNRIAELSYMQC